MERRAYARRDVLGAVSAVGAVAVAGCDRLGGSADQRIEVPEESLRDEPVEIRLRGFEPSSTVTVRASTTFGGGPHWEAEATFEADDRGEVDLTTQAPTSGTYDETDGMGLFWSMVRDEGEATGTGDDGMASPSPTPSKTTPRTEAIATGTPADPGLPDAYDVTLRAGTDGETRTTATTTRRFVAEGVERTSVEEDGVVGEFFVPPGDGPHPGVVALHGSRGYPMIRHGRMLASHGYATLALRYFGPHEAIPDELVDVPLSYFERAITWLRDRESVGTGDVGVLGSSRGGEAALLVGARDDRVGAVVGYVPSVYLWGGWEADGDELPAVPRFGSPTVTENGTSFAPMYRQSVETADDERVAQATIPVEDIDAPVLLITGEDDEMWPAAWFAEVAVQRLSEDGFEHDYDHRSYADAGHGIGIPYVPTAETTSSGTWAFGGTPAGNARAAADSWPRVLDWLGKGLE
ncbi:acyl-CoA thioester hydrolase/BAAT C-terminal domain-containing protein [Halosimplex salinum]|uniref:acyl-CoA thioester hydrolase/BAAT C-terminal domain-containing protein n=1 Tax=Halosimplex salinum TaxID=1710538 RepID=UPI000F4A3D53|nr:acyl-CoA thioester hydrolase/BAAT C-terminal domain-containing protein [Halosimplex salinum]